MEFKLDAEQVAIFQEWKKTQETKGRTKDCIGFRYTFCFSPTSLGDNVVVVDTITGEVLDLTGHF